MTKDDLKAGHVYEAKKPKKGWDGLVNDRQIMWMSRGEDRVQYDSPSVDHGRRFPIISVEAFLKWAGQDVTDSMPKGEWRKER